MGVVPDSRLAKIEFFEQHLAAWTANAVSIGLTAGVVTALGTQTTAARAAYDAAGTARDAAKSATQEFYDQVDTLAGMGSTIIKQIKTFAESTANPNVYTLAQIPPPATPAPTPPPGTPEAFRVELLQSGALVLTWKCPNPPGVPGTVYEVRRRLGGAGAFAYVGSTGGREFEDQTLPAGQTSATYQVTAIRSTSRGNPGQFTVSFGIDGGDGAMSVASVVEAPQMKMAA
jgi:hypothetical protein